MEPSSDALAEYCDEAPPGDSACFSSRYGNNVRALEDFLDGPEEWGGVQETTATAQGLTEAPVGSTVDVLRAILPLDLATVIDAKGGCTAALDETAQLGVVSDVVTGPRGDVEVIQAYLIGNPVVRTSDGLGLGSTSADLSAAHPDIVIEPTEGGGSVALTPVERALEDLAASDTRRVMFFRLNEDDQVSEWGVGVPSRVAFLCSGS